MGLLIIVAFIAFVLYNPGAGAIIFIAMTAIIEMYAGYLVYKKPELKIDKKYSEFEQEIIRKYHIFFMYPVAARALSSFLSGIQLSVFILTPYLILKGFWIHGIIIGLNYFLASQFSVPLNPQHFLHDNLDKGKIKDAEFARKARLEMNAIDSIMEKMYLSKG